MNYKYVYDIYIKLKYYRTSRINIYMYIFLINVLMLNTIRLRFSTHNINSTYENAIYYEIGIFMRLRSHYHRKILFYIRRQFKIFSNITINNIRTQYKDLQTISGIFFQKPLNLKGLF